MDTNVKNEQVLELPLDQMSEIAGGKDVYGGLAKDPGKKPGCKVYQIKPNETLTGIAHRNNTTVAEIMKLNPSITNASKIRAGFYIYLPA